MSRESTPLVTTSNQGVFRNDNYIFIAKQIFI